MTIEDDRQPARRQSDGREGDPGSPQGPSKAEQTLDTNKLVGLIPSSKRIDANRANAKQSSGPRTKPGKSHSRLNALKHGAFATRRLVPGEDKKAYKQLSKRIFAEANPKTTLELMLVDQIIGDIWRLKRVEQAERAYLEEVRVSALARALRSLSATETHRVPNIVRLTTTPSADSTELCPVRQKLESAVDVDKLMLDGMVSPDRAFPYSSIQQIRRFLVRDVLRNGESLTGLNGDGIASSPFTTLSERLARKEKIER